MSHTELTIPWKVIPKARPRFDPATGRAYTAKRYRDFLESTAGYVALNHRGAPYEGPLLIRAAFTDHDIEIVVADTSPVEYTARRFDLDNAVGAVMDALQHGGVVGNDRDIVKLETWIR